jgi:hypothetical protein
MNRPEPENIAAASQAGLVFLSVCEPAAREETIRTWAETVRKGLTSHAGRVGGYFTALVTAYPTMPTLNLRNFKEKTMISDAIIGRWNTDKHIDTRISILKSLTESEMLEQNPADFLGLVYEGLQDYTTNARGDVGSHVRLQAIKAIRSIWESPDVEESPGLQRLSASLFLRTLSLAAEKLDRVRVEAQTTLMLALNPM